jgi:GDP-L-fucose synthase
MNAGRTCTETLVSQEPTKLDWSRARVLLTGGAGFLGSWVARGLSERGVCDDRITIPRSAACDLRDPLQAARAVGELLAHAQRHHHQPIVLHCAGLSGGLALNRERPLDLYHDNLAMGTNVIMAQARAGAALANTPAAPRLVLVGHMTSYPTDERIAPQPLREESLMAGPLDPVTAKLGTAKGELLFLARFAHTRFGLASIMVVPTNLYGEGDAMDNPAKSHAAGAMIWRFAQAVRERTPSITHWGTGRAIRDFLHVQDAARGILAAAERLECHAGPPIAVNLGSGQETTLRDLSDTIQGVSGYTGRVDWDASKPDGVPRRVLNIRRAREVLGWMPQVTLEQGVARTLAAIEKPRA